MRTYQAKTTHDLLENTSITFETLRQAWRNARIEVETASSGRATCRICGKPIEKGEQRVVSSSWDLVRLYNAFWCMKVYAHLSCYEKIVKGIFDEDGRQLSQLSHFRRHYFCKRCGWIPKFLAANGRCPYCGGPLRMTPRRKSFLRVTRIEPEFNVKIRRIKGQLTLDTFQHHIIWLKRSDGSLEPFEVE